MRAVGRGDPDKVIFYDLRGMLALEGGIWYTIGTMKSGVAMSVDELERLGERLRVSLRSVIVRIPGAPHKPTPLASKLGMSRVTVSRILRAIEHESAYEVLEALPGPESLRGVVNGAEGMSIEREALEEAGAAIDAFGWVIRDQFGTRSALNAAIRPLTGTLRERVDHAGRSEVFRGMSQILGVEAQTWITSMIFAPNPDDEDMVSVMTLHGALGVRRLRPDTAVYFTFGPPPEGRGHERELSGVRVSLEDLYHNEPVVVESTMLGERLVHRLVNDRLGKDATGDMLSVSMDKRGSRRYAADATACLRGASIFVDFPVRLLLCDAIVHKDVFPGSDPELMVFNPGARGPANPNDLNRHADLVDFESAIEEVEPGAGMYDVHEVPNYGAMMRRVFDAHWCDQGDFRVYRMTIAYPVTAFQHVIAFEAPVKG